ncbi:MAG: PSD1 domain-containing protein [Planctomycetales bacterium]|nr:PSD1 domain-containing protein [Planctomycetales bacterium]MBN8625132.1 PSD1 domain-containing protein [Planctomycetota bacterium]
MTTGSAIDGRIYLVILAVLISAKNPSFVVAAEAKPDKAAVEFFEAKVRPVLVKHCYECHSEKSKIVQANLYVDTRDGLLRGGDSGPAVVPGDVQSGTLLEALRFETVEMPPKGKLPDDVIADFAKWIEKGAVDPRDGKAPTVATIDFEAGRKHWAFQQPKIVPPAATTDKSWARNDVDRYVLAKLEAEGLAPVADADCEQLLRRLSFELTGLPPTPEEQQTFAADGSPHAVEKVVDRLLASPHFGERFGRHWLDVARYAESCGKERNIPYRIAWRYRDYVIDAFNNDLPYDQFVREQLAGELLPDNAQVSDAERNRRLIGTGFLVIGPKSLTERNPEQYTLDVCDEQLDTTCRAFLASTAGCARCHDHKFDPIPQTDYYALAGIFRSTENVPGVKSLLRITSYPDAMPLDGPQKSRSLELQKLIAEWQKKLTDAENFNRQANKSKDPQMKAEATQRIADVQAKLLELRNEAESDEHGPRFAMAVRDGKPKDYELRIRGEVDNLGPVVPRGLLTVLTNENTPKIGPQESGRLQLAQWIASRDNPLTARVMVNRVWSHLFGRGLVESTDNFGLLGDKPSHPELLDYLALRFMDEGWSVKRLVREIVLSRTFQMSSRVDRGAFAQDPDNRNLWRFTPQRLEAEALRDSLLFAAGRLTLERPYASTSLSLTNLELGSSAKILAADESPRVRSVYLPMLRGNVPETLSLFDMADPSLVTGKREVTIVAPQALFLMNSTFVGDQARYFAERLLASSDFDDAGRLELAYRLTLSRPPTDAERTATLDFLQTRKKEIGGATTAAREAWISVCQALFATGEFRYVR